MLADVSILKLILIAFTQDSEPVFTTNPKDSNFESKNLIYYVIISISEREFSAFVFNVSK